MPDSCARTVKAVLRARSGWRRPGLRTLDRRKGGVYARVTHGVRQERSGRHSDGCLAERCEAQLWRQPGSTSFQKKGRKMKVGKAGNASGSAVEAAGARPTGNMEEASREELAELVGKVLAEHWMRKETGVRRRHDPGNKKQGT